ncbi:MAG TPA: hypothetical protein VMF51_01865 [Nocardioides sp.]|uniref:hypothetical protein n=1 Tax=Nocardioides sp. TaxID=35761 RepID=UPI002C88EFFC|nr:hypothetical protein [Nocardioides sp.]HTW13840.1 hypothetical protein [Nocardioides sp.]
MHGWQDDDAWGDNPAPEGRAGHTSQRGRVSPGRSLVLRAESCDLSPAIAAQLVYGQSWKDLASAWKQSSVALKSAGSHRHRLALVMLRAAILDEMEAMAPRAFSDWLATQSCA